MPNSTGTKRTASGRSLSRSSASSRQSRRRARPASAFVVCLRNDGYDVDLMRGRLYPVLPDRHAAAEGMIRIVDESGEDYLYPSEWFSTVKLPLAARRALSRT